MEGDRNKGLSNHQIYTIAKLHFHTKHLFRNCYTPDTLPEMVEFPSCFVCNTSLSWQAGVHWLALFCPSPYTPSEIFDSRAMGTDAYSNLVEKFLLRNGNGTYKINTFAYQPQTTFTCGYFALTFLDWRCAGVTFEEGVKRFSKTKLEQNDLLVQDYVYAHMSPLSLT